MDGTFWTHSIKINSIMSPIPVMRYLPTLHNPSPVDVSDLLIPSKCNILYVTKKLRLIDI